MSAATQHVVVVAFSSRCGATEHLALCAAVGAVQARALIRMRRLPDVDHGQPAPTGDCADNLARMRKQYVPPSEADLLGADAFVFAPSAGMTVSSDDWTEFLALLTRLALEGKVTGKAVTIVDVGSEPTLLSFQALMLRLGLIVVPPDGRQPQIPTPASAERATWQGRTVGNVAKALKATPPHVPI
jgi:hypothetical protein